MIWEDEWGENPHLDFETVQRLYDHLVRGEIEDAIVLLERELYPRYSTPGEAEKALEACRGRQ